MATERIVRVTRIWDIVVDAEYGDEDQALLDKADPESIDPTNETKNLLPEN